MRLSLLFSLMLLSICSNLYAQSAPYALHAENLLSAEGNQRVLAIELDNSSSNIGGYSYGLCFDQNLAVATEIDFGSIYPIGGQELALYEIHDGGVNIVVIVGGHGGSSVLPAGDGLHLDTITFELTGNPGTPVPVQFCDSVGPIPYDITLVELSVEITDIDLFHGELMHEKAFLRADCNGDGSQDIADSIFLESYLFLGGDTPDCLTACDSNNDGRVDIADSIYSLSYLFSQGQPPATPWPDCGFDTVPSEVACHSSQCP